MAYNDPLANRVRELRAATHTITGEKKMFGGLCFMVDHKMCMGIESERIMLRIDPSTAATLLEKGSCQPMDFTGKIMKGYVFVDIAELNTQKQLRYWIQLALDYNPFAKASKKKHCT